jgi:hypothetical protein
VNTRDTEGALKSIIEPIVRASYTRSRGGTNRQVCVAQFACRRSQLSQGVIVRFAAGVPGVNACSWRLPTDYLESPLSTRFDGRDRPHSGGEMCNAFDIPGEHITAAQYLAITGACESGAAFPQARPV